MDKIIQMPLPLVWWHDIEKWRIRHTVDVVGRPTEAAALDNVYYAARLAKGLRLGTKLSKLEQRIYRLERQIKAGARPKNDTPYMLAKDIHDELVKDIVTKRRGNVFTKPSPFVGQVSGVLHVLGMLDDISYAMRGYAQHEAWIEQNWQQGALTEALNEFEAVSTAIAVAA